MSATSGVSGSAILLRLAGQAILRRRTLANHARPLADIASSQGGRTSLSSIAMSCVVGRARAGAWTAREGGAEVVAAAGRLRGRSCWQVAHLVSRDDAEAAAERALERVSAAAGRSGAQRVFLRMPAGCDLLGAAHRAGFFPAYHETLLVAGRPDVPASPTELCGVDPREATDQDEYDLFRLYSAATPSEVRRLAGVTFDQWRDSRERVPGSTREYVLGGQRGLAGWLRVGRIGANGWLQATSAPGVVDASATLAAFGLERLAGARQVRALAAEFQPDFRRALTAAGFAPACEYAVCIRTTASSVRLTGRAEARA